METATAEEATTSTLTREAAETKKKTTVTNSSLYGPEPVEETLRVLREKAERRKAQESQRQLQVNEDIEMSDNDIAIDTVVVNLGD